MGGSGSGEGGRGEKGVSGRRNRFGRVLLSPPACELMREVLSLRPRATVTHFELTDVIRFLDASVILSLSRSSVEQQKPATYDSTGRVGIRRMMQGGEAVAVAVGSCMALEEA